MAMTFVPLTGQTAFADEPEGDFDASGQVTGLKLSSAAYNSVTLQWSPYAGAEGYELYRGNAKDGKFKLVKRLTDCKYKDKANKKLGKSKYYYVRAYVTEDDVNMFTANSAILAAKPKLGKPAGLTSSAGTGQVTIKWKKVTGASGYQVYRATSKNGKYKKSFTTKHKYYINTSVTTGKKYYYKVRAYRKQHGKKFGTFSEPIEGVSKPAAASGFKTTIAKDGTVTSTWSKVTGAVGYQIQRASSKNGDYVNVGETASTTFKDKLTKGGQYFYRIRAYSRLNGKRVYGAFSSGGRASAVKQARKWVGARESNGSHKKIIDVFNNYGPSCGKIGYRTAWCAAFVSAVAIKTGNTSIIPVHSYCPTMLSKFAKKTYKKKYTPQGGDVVFYDWNWNKVPDHVGMIESVSGDYVTAIEGNCSDSVKRRVFKKGYSFLLAYGLPKYTVNNVVTYKAPNDPDPEPGIEPDPDTPSETPPVPEPSEEVVDAACAAITEEITQTDEPAEDTAAFAEETVPAVESEAAEDTDETADAESAEDSAAFAEGTDEETAEAADDADAATEPETAEAAEAAEPAEPVTDVETAERIIDYIQEEEPAADAAAGEGEYNAFLVLGICEEMDIDACVVTVTHPDGSVDAYNEVVLDGDLYVLDATADGGVLETYTPEEIY